MDDPLVVVLFLCTVVLICTRCKFRLNIFIGLTAARKSGLFIAQLTFFTPTYHNLYLVQIGKIVCKNGPTFKVTRHLCFKNRKNMRPQDILPFHSANKPSFQNRTKSLFAQCSILKSCSIRKNYKPERPEVANFCIFQA